MRPDPDAYWTEADLKRVAAETCLRGECWCYIADIAHAQAVANKLGDSEFARALAALRVAQDRLEELMPDSEKQRIVADQ